MSLSRVATVGVGKGGPWEGGGGGTGMGGGGGGVGVLGGDAGAGEVMQKRARTLSMNALGAGGDSIACAGKGGEEGGDGGDGGVRAEGRW